MKHILIIIMVFLFGNLYAIDSPSENEGKSKEDVYNIVIHGNAYIHYVTTTDIEVWCYTNPDRNCVEGCYDTELQKWKVDINVIRSMEANCYEEPTYLDEGGKTIVKCILIN